MTALRRYVNKLRGSSHGGPPRVNMREVVWSWIGGFFGMATLGLLNQCCFSTGDATLLIGSFGASAVLVYGAPRSPLAQPRNLVGGHLVSALIGVLAWQGLGAIPWLAAATAVATAMAAMHLTRTLHPPGGATALIAVTGSDQIHAAGFGYVVVPATVGPLVLLLVGLFINNLAAHRRYPETWW